MWEKILQNPFWHNSLLLQLGYDPRNVTNAEVSRLTCLSACTLALGNHDMYMCCEVVGITHILHHFFFPHKHRRRQWASNKHCLLRHCWYLTMPACHLSVKLTASRTTCFTSETWHVDCPREGTLAHRSSNSNCVYSAFRRLRG